MLFSTVKCFFKISLLYNLCFSTYLHAQNNEFNILGWGHVLDISEGVRNKVKNIEKTCDISISYDRYSNYQDFLTQLVNHDYEYNIVLIPDTHLSLISKHIPKDRNHELDTIINSYNPYVKNHFKMLDRTGNITYFAQSLTGILINKDKIKTDNINNIQDLVGSLNKNDMLMVLDDPTELSSLIESDISKRKDSLKKTSDIINNIRKFNGLIKDKNVTIVNFYNKRMDENNFAAAISWSGEAIRDISIISAKGKNNLKFLTPKDFSIISSDVLVQLKRDNATDCAMKMLSSQALVDEVNFEMNYFSPFISYDTMKNKNNNYYKIQQQYIAYLPHANWLDSVEKEGFDKVIYEWEKLKFNAIRSKSRANNKTKS